MLNEKRTEEEFGYTSVSLAPKSNKKIILSCDYCQSEFVTSKQNRLLAHRAIVKDACRKCRSIKIGDINEFKYGVRNTFQRESVKKKIVATNLDRYGVARPTQSQEIKDKVKKTCLERFGTEYSLSATEVRTKIAKTCLEKYGSENPSSAEECKDKRKKTCLEKFGKEYYLGSEDCIKKTKETLGVDNVFQLEETKQKSRETMIRKYGVDNPNKIPEISAKIKERGLATKRENGQIQSYEGKEVNDWLKITGFSRSRFSTLVKKHGWDVAVKLTPKMSSLETLLKSHFDEIGIEYSTQVKLGSYFADFCIGKIIIEVDGLFWHSEYHKKDNYHIKKRELYTSLGYDPLFFREDELTTKFHIVKSIINNKLGFSTRLFARKLQISTISKAAGNSFLEENHLMGKGKGDCFALTKDGQIMSVLRVCKIKDGWEISRFASKVGYTIVGGFSRLLSYFTAVFQPEKVVTFIDLRYGSGEYLTSLGFVKGKSHPSFKWTNGQETFHRMKFPSSTGRDSGFYKIWDCGQLKYVK